MIIEELDNIIKTINFHNEWTKNEKIRYAYIALGKIVHKDSMFFYTIQNNLLTDDKDKLKYNIDKIEKIIGTENYFDYSVVCRTSAEMLQYILKNCGIECEVRRTLDSDIYTSEEKNVEIRHFFLVATGDENKKYFLTLNPDLPNIKIGKLTSHFGNAIEYLVQKKDKITGEVHYEQVYEGDEIEYSLMDEEKIKKLDSSIGYLDELNYIYDDENKTTSVEYTDYFFGLLRKTYRTDYFYLNILASETEFYYDLANLLNGTLDLNEVLDRRKKLTEEEIDNVCLNFSFQEKTANDWEDVKSFLLVVIVRLYDRFDVKLDNEVLKMYSNCIETKDYDKIFENYKDALFKTINPKEISKLGDFNPLKNMKDLIKLLKTIDKLILIEDFQSQEFLSVKKDFSEGIEEISKQFILKKHLPLNRNSLSNTYITKKIYSSFKKIFDIGYKTSFNDLELAEQVAIIKEILEMVLQDVKADKRLPNYDARKSPIQNRLLSTVIFSKQDNKPFYLICVKKNKIEQTEMSGYTPIIYDLKENTISMNQSLTYILSNYHIIKDADIKLMIEEIYNNEDNKDKNI